MRVRLYFVYIMSSFRRTIYTGVTGNLEQRVRQHKNHQLPGFTDRYHVTRLVYCEPYREVRLALAREKQIKGWRRSKKVALIESVNPEWHDLAARDTSGVFGMTREGCHSERSPAIRLAGRSEESGG